MKLLRYCILFYEIVNLFTIYLIYIFWNIFLLFQKVLPQQTCSLIIYYEICFPNLGIYVCHATQIPFLQFSMPYRTFKKSFFDKKIAYFWFTKFTSYFNIKCFDFLLWSYLTLYIYSYCSFIVLVKHYTNHKYCTR